LIDTARQLLEDAVRDADTRLKHIKDPRVDDIVRALCEQWGYGAVMDSAMRQWLQKDERGALIIAGCMSTCRAVLDAEAVQQLATVLKAGT
jgi:isochorismate hydrolase